MAKIKQEDFQFAANRNQDAIEFNSGGFGDITSLIGDVEWRENILHQYDTYTYNLKLFTVDQPSAIKFLSGAITIDEIHAGSWPEENTAIIAQTGTTGEIVIDDLEIHSIGNTENARAGGVATRLSFTLTGVGNTFLIDRILDTVAVMGYAQLPSAVFFMEISFNGYVNGVQKTLEERRILPFAISKYKDLTTESTVTGTVATFEGIIIPDIAFKPENDLISKAIQYDVSSDLADSLNSLIDALNEAMIQDNFTDETRYSNTYSLSWSDEFDSLYAHDNPIMLPDQPNHSYASNDGVDEKATGGRAMAVAVRRTALFPNTSIKNTIVELLKKSTKVSKALTETTDTFTKIPYVKVYVVPKEDGLNLITGEQGYEIKYFIGVRKELVDQTLSDSIKKAQNANDIVQELIDTGRLNKVYFSDYTGLNTDILEFSVRLDQQLTKTYNSYIDEYAILDHLVSLTDGIEGLNENARQKLLDLKREGEEARFNTAIEQENLEAQQSVLQERDAEYRRSLLAALSGELQSAGASEAMAQYNQMSTDELMNLGLSDDSIVGEAVRGTYSSQEFENRESQKKIINEALRGRNTAQTEQIGISREEQRIVNQVVGRSVSKTILDSAKQARANLNLPPVILSEDLDTDIRFSLSAQTQGAILNAILTNPGMFKNVTYTYIAEENKLRAIPTNTEYNENLVSAKYNEGVNLDMSMYKANMTIIGDPMWIDHFIDPSKLNEIFGENNTHPDTNKNVVTTLNGYNAVLVVRNAMRGADYQGNAQIDNLFAYVYMVKNITSVFSGGEFTQTLDMVRLDPATNFMKKPGGENGSPDIEEDEKPANTDTTIKPEQTRRVVAEQTQTPKSKSVTVTASNTDESERLAVLLQQRDYWANRLDFLINEGATDTSSIRTAQANLDNYNKEIEEFNN